MKESQNAQAQLFPTELMHENEADYPVLLNISGKGPSPMDPNLIKPDLCCPGQFLVPTKRFITEVCTDTTDLKCPFHIVTGTSFSNAFIAGVVTYLLTKYPDFFPAAIKSTLLTTAKPMHLKAKNDCFGVGSGVVNVEAALSVALVYDVHPDDYLRYLNWLNVRYPLQLPLPSELKELVDRAESLGVIHSRNLNLPTFGAAFQADENAWMFLRKLRSVRDVKGIWSCCVSDIQCLIITPTPKELQFENVGDEKELKLLVEVTDRSKCVDSANRHFLGMW